MEIIKAINFSSASVVDRNTKMDKRPLNRFERRKLRTKNKLKDAAIQLILEKGYEAVTIQDITDRADLGRATFYIHYKDKEDLMWDAVSVSWKSFMIKMSEVQNSNNAQEPALFYGLLADLQMAEENRDLYRIIFGGAGPTEILRRTKEDIIADIHAGIYNELFMLKCNLPIELVAQFMVGAISQVIIWWLETPNSYSAEQMAEMLSQMFEGLVQS